MLDDEKGVVEGSQFGERGKDHPEETSESDHALRGEVEAEEED